MYNVPDMGWSGEYGGDREPGAWGGTMYGAVHQYNIYD